MASGTPSRCEDPSIPCACAPRFPFARPSCLRHRAFSLAGRWHRAAGSGRCVARAARRRLWGRDGKDLRRCAGVVQVAARTARCAWPGRCSGSAMSRRSASTYGQRHRVSWTARAPFRDALAAGFPDWAARLGPDHVLGLDVLGEVSETALTPGVRDYDGGERPAEHLRPGAQFAVLHLRRRARLSPRAEAHHWRHVRDGLFRLPRLPATTRSRRCRWC